MRARKICCIFILSASNLIPLSLNARQDYYEKQINFPGLSPFNGFVNNSAIIFPSYGSVSRPTAPPTPAGKECPVEAGSIYYKGMCSLLLSNLACEVNEWLVTNQEGNPHCVMRPCPFEELLYEGKCVNIASDTVCGISEILFVEFTGEVYCDCIEGFIYDQPIRKCVAEHRQGSCPPGMVLELQQNQITCIKNRCPTDDQVYNPKEGQCYVKTFEGSCLEEGTSLMFNKIKNTASCAAISNKNIFQFHSTGCKQGTRRSHDNKCRKVFQKGKASPSRVQAPHPLFTSKCPPFFRRTPNGSCIRNRQ